VKELDWLSAGSREDVDVENGAVVAALGADSRQLVHRNADVGPKKEFVV
jgi:hypothetical protein